MLDADPDGAVAMVGPDHLAGGVLRSLSRNFRGQFSWGVMPTLFFGVLSFGALPLIVWMRDFGHYVRLERQQLWHLCEWLRLQTAHPDAAALPSEADRIPTRIAAIACAWIWLAAAAVFVVGNVWHAPQPLRALLASTYGARAPHSPLFHADVFLPWTIGLSIAYGWHWLAIQLHAADLRRFVRQLNQVVQWEGVRPLTLQGVGIGAQPLWMLAAFVMILGGAFWGFPMMLAGALQRRYISRTSGRFRVEAAEAVRTMLMLRRPAMAVPTFVRPAILCRVERCRAPIPPLASFCPRCGARAGTVLSDVA